MQSVTVTNITPEEFSTLLKGIVREEIAAFNTSKSDEKLLSSSEVLKLFVPSISRVTLITWEKKGYIQSSRIGGKKYFRYSEVIEAVKTLKRYKRPTA